MKKTIKKFINKIDRFFQRTEPEDLLKYFKAQPSNYEADQKLIGNRYASWEEYNLRNRRC